MIKGYAADRGDANYFTIKWLTAKPVQAQFLGITATISNILKLGCEMFAACAASVAATLSFTQSKINFSGQEYG